MTGIPDKENFDFKETINFPVFPQQNIKILFYSGVICVFLTLNMKHIWIFTIGILCIQGIGLL